MAPRPVSVVWKVLFVLVIAVAVKVTPQHQHDETMNGVCQQGNKKMGDNGNIVCEPVGKKSQDGLKEGTVEGHASSGSNDDVKHFDDCSELHTALEMSGEIESGEFEIKPVGSNAFSVYCDMHTDGGGWTVIQRRFNGTIHFNRLFNDYKYGFGSASGEHWLGLENMYRITAQNTYELYVELVDWYNIVKYAKYSSFRVGVGDDYQLSLSSYTGNAGDCLLYHSGNKFSAGDRDQDTSGGNCAGSSYNAGGWWYGACAQSALNGPYLRPSDRTSHSGRGIYWDSASAYNTYLKKSKMMIRPADFRTGK